MAFFSGPFRNYAFEYEYGHSSFSQVIVASSEEEAKGRCKALATARFVGCPVEVPEQKNAQDQLARASNADPK